MAGAWGCPGLDSATARACRSQIWPERAPPCFAHTRRYDGVAALQTNLSLADSWLAGMASGASAAGLAVQYCMPYAHDILAGAAHAAVTNARATDDYFHG